MARNQRRSKNNNPEGRNQYSGGIMDIARERPMTAAAVAAGAAATGLFLWSKRTQISDQISNLSDQIGEWSQNMNWGSDTGTTFDDSAGLTAMTPGKSKGMSETGGGNASLGRRSGGGGSTGSVSGRGRARSNPTT